MTNTTNYVAYYRVSTAKQGRSGLGLEAQRQAVERFAAGRGQLVGEFQEVESGANDERPELAKALETCRKQKATLVIAKLDRLSRSISFVVQLQESLKRWRVSLVCCDMPDATEFTLHIFAALAQQERKMISDRTKAALAPLRGTGKLGNPELKTRGKELSEKANAVKRAKAKEYSDHIGGMVHDLRHKGMTYDEIAAELVRRGTKTPRGEHHWQRAQVKRLLDSYAEQQPRSNVISR